MISLVFSVTVKFDIALLFEFGAKINNLKAILTSQWERVHSLKKKGDSRHVPQSIDAKEERFSIECGKPKPE